MCGLQDRFYTHLRTCLQQQEDLESCPTIDANEVVAHGLESFAADPNDASSAFEPPSNSYVRSSDSSCECGEGDVTAVLTSHDHCSVSEDSSASSIRPKISNWRVIWALIMTNGSRKLTRESYQSVRNLMKYFGRQSATASNRIGTDSNETSFKLLPQYTTLHRTYKPFLLNVLAPRGQEHHERVDIRKAGARASTSIGEPRVASQPNGANISTSVCSQYFVDKLPVVAARDWFYGPKRHMSVDVPHPADYCTSFAEVGDTVSQRVLQTTEFVEPFVRCFGNPTHPRISNSVCGIVSHAWTVHHVKRRDNEDFREEYSYAVQQRDEEIARLLRFQSYSSPSDGATAEIPDLPAEDHCCRLDDAGPDGSSTFRGTAKKRMSAEMMAAVKARRAAIRTRKRQMEEAWEH